MESNRNRLTIKLAVVVTKNLLDFIHAGNFSLKKMLEDI